MTRNESLIRFAATEVMGWHQEDIGSRAAWWDGATKIMYVVTWNPIEGLNAWHQAGMLVSKLRNDTNMDSKAYYALRTAGRLLLGDDDDLFLLSLTPHALTGAVCRSLGWTGEDADE